MLDQPFFSLQFKTSFKDTFHSDTFSCTKFSFSEKIFFHLLNFTEG